MQNFNKGCVCISLSFLPSTEEARLSHMRRSSTLTPPARGALVRTVEIAGRQLRFWQHFMDKPVVQPRRPGGPRADLTGLKLWPVSLRLLDHLRADVLPALRAERDRPLRVLELGAGVGSLGIGLAAVGERVLLTDPGMPVWYSEDEEGTTLSWLHANVDTNREVVGERAAVAQLLWGDEAHEAAVKQWDGGAPFDLVVGADLLYDPDQYPALLRTLAAFASPRTTAVLGFSRRHPGEARFLKSAERVFADVTTRDHIADGPAQQRWAVSTLRDLREPT